MALYFPGGSCNEEEWTVVIRNGGQFPKYQYPHHSIGHHQRYVSGISSEHPQQRVKTQQLGLCGLRSDGSLCGLALLWPLTNKPRFTLI